MIYYNFDGIRLPKPVELNGYNYQLICSNKDELFFTHSLMISKAPFEVLNDKICFDSAKDYQFYTARNNSTSWSEGSLTIIENDKATTTLVPVIDSSDFLWTNEDIYRYKSDEIVYKKFEAEEEIVALKPKIKTNLSQDKYYHQDDENVEALKIEAESPDGGELSYQWYKNGEKIEGANSNTYKPIITEIGKNTYYCEITNNYQGDLASINSKAIIITIAEALIPINEEFLLGWKIGRLVAMMRGGQEPAGPLVPDFPEASITDKFNYCDIDGNVKFTAPIYPIHPDAPYVYISNYTILGSKHLTLFAMPAPINKYETILYNTTIFGCQEADLNPNFNWYCYEYWYNNSEEMAKGWVKDETRTLTYYEGDYGWGDVRSGPMWSTGSSIPSWTNSRIVDYANGEIYMPRSSNLIPYQE